MRTPRTAVAVSAYLNTATLPALNPVQQHRFLDHDPYAYGGPNNPRLSQRQQQNPQALPHRLSSSFSSGARSLRRTPRLQEGRITSAGPPAKGIATREQVAFTQTGSTSPQSFQKLVKDETFWPRRTTRISRRTHEAILFALEAIRSGRGVDARPLTTDQLEEEARMSDLYMSRPQDARAQADAAAQQAGITTPRQIMAARNAREARKAQQEATLRQTQEVDPSRRRQTENVVGVGTDPRRQQTSRTNYSEAEATSRLPAGQNVTIGGRSDHIPASNGLATRSGNATVNQGQPRPVAGQQTQQSSQFLASQRAGQNSGDASIQRNRTEAYERLEMPAVAGTRPPPPQDLNYGQPSDPAPGTKVAFPHAFERWETLSSHWEGLTSYWIRRLQENTNELDGKPIDKGMARQITDLSAAGANLFHAVVELQRLRASSERKFQRWFFETRNEQEQTQEKIAQLQEQLRQEKQRVPQVTNATAEASQADKMKTDELRRELQISKEEARRAWEELGRREQEERERTIALRSGEPTLIGGVQVLPMQGLSSRHNTSASQRPVTRDGPYQGGPTATMMGGQQPLSRSQTTLESPTQEHQQYNYQPETTSPTDTDPFTEPTRLRHEPDTQFVATGSPQGRQPMPMQPPVSSRSVASPIHSQRSAHNQSEGPSYIPSTRSGAGSAQSEEEYHTRNDGSLILDPHGRPIPYRQPLGGVYQDVDSDDEDHAADMEREDMLAQQYAQRQQAARTGALPRQQHLTPSRSPQHFQQSAYNQATVTPGMQQTPFFSETSPAESRHTGSSTLSPVTPQQQMSARMTSPGHDPADYEGVGYGEDSPSMYPPPQTSAAEQQAASQRAHHVPTRLSDIIEERTEPSRSSAISATPTTHSDTQGGILGTRR